MLENNDRFYISVGYTLIDITQTDDITTTKATRNRQRNWETVKQVLGLKTNIEILTPPHITELAMTKTKFGTNFKGKQLVWFFKFGIEFSNVWEDKDGPYGRLEKDFENVPIILGLTETAKIKLPIFTTSEGQRNIYFVPE